MTASCRFERGEEMEHTKKLRQATDTVDVLFCEGALTEEEYACIENALRESKSEHRFLRALKANCILFPEIKRDLRRAFDRAPWLHEQIPDSLRTIFDSESPR